jgi:tetratricopeptide (TPR) repeat protein
MLLTQNSRLADARLADEIRKLCYKAWASDTKKVRPLARAAASLAKFNNDTRISATANWTAGIAAITSGQFEKADESLRQAAELFSANSSNAESAAVKVARLICLAMLGRYDEAIRIGQSTKKIFASLGDHLSKGKVEMNLSNIFARRGSFDDALRYGTAARLSFLKANDRRWLVMAENSLANTLADIGCYGEAEQMYESALANAAAGKMDVTAAEIEASIGHLAVIRSRFARALHFLERSRGRYDELKMPHQSAIADLEIADIYAELGLSSRAVELYRRSAAAFRRFRLRAEEARARLALGRALSALQARGAETEFAAAAGLFAEEKNNGGVAAAYAASAEDALRRGLPEQALEMLSKFRRTDAADPRTNAAAAFTEGRALLRLGRRKDAAKAVEKALSAARRHSLDDLTRASYEALGEIHGSVDIEKAVSYLYSAVEAAERARASVAGADLGLAVAAKNAECYDSLTKLLLKQGKYEEAFSIVERGRSRDLLNAMNTGVSGRRNSKLKHAANEMRRELNLIYSRLASETGEEAERLSAAARRKEKALADLERRSSSLNIQEKGVRRANAGLSANDIVSAIARGRTLVEYVVLDGIISAFSVSEGKLRYFHGLAAADEAAALMDELRFGFGAMRYGGEFAARFAEIIKQRSDACLAKLYGLLIRPLEGVLSKELMIVPAGVLHYIPFNALFDGSSYLAEKYTVTLAPSASVWHRLKNRRPAANGEMLIIGYADEKIPHVDAEVAAIAATVKRAVRFSGKHAAYDAFMSNAAGREYIHLACHADFRSDDPMYSGLHLADGWVTVRDLVSEKMSARLVVLSACETGMSDVRAGDEVVGLTRGFLAAGACGLAVSLWAVNDRSTAELMKYLYAELQRGSTAAASLRQAQIRMIGRGHSPYHWGAFVYLGK